MQNFLDLCRNRRSIRKYTSQLVEEDKLKRIVQCALMAPSGKRVNPWQFYVVREEDKLRPLASCRTYGSGMFQTATAGVVVAVDTSLTDVWQMDAAIAAHNLLLAAEDEGLGACWCQIYMREGAENLVKQTVGVPDNLTVVCVVSMGYKDEERKSYDLEKLSYDKVHGLFDEE